MSLDACVLKQTGDFYMSDLSFLYSDTDFRSIKRFSRLDDPSHPGSYSPTTSNYAPPTSGDSLTMTHHSVSMDGLEEEEHKRDLAGRAQQSLEEALEHSDRDVVIKNTLELLLEQYEDKNNKYHLDHPEPGYSDKEEFVGEPEWASKFSSSKKVSPINRIGSPLKEDNFVIADLELKLKALDAGMNFDDIRAADTVLDRLFDSEGGRIRKKF